MCVWVVSKWLWLVIIVLGLYCWAVVSFGFCRVVVPWRGSFVVRWFLSSTVVLRWYGGSEVVLRWYGGSEVVRLF